MASTPQVASLHVYPLKSAGGIAVEAAEVTEAGLRWDRHWMLVDADGAFMSQRTHPRMSLLRTALGEDRLTVSAPGRSDLELPLHRSPDADQGPSTGPSPSPSPVRIWSHDRFTGDCGDEVAAWMSAFMEEPCRVVRAEEPPDGPRVTEEGRIRTGFADAAPGLLISRASLDDLNARLDDPLPMNRFRPNVVVADVGAFAEDGWERVRLGAVPARGGWPCARCTITTVDQDTGRKGTEPLRTLATFRRNEAGRVEFGMNVLFDGTGVLRVGDMVDVLEERTA